MIALRSGERSPTDLTFALDSILAIFGITTDPFIVYACSICAIGGLAIVLIFVGVRMALSDIYSIGIELALLVITDSCAGSLSLLEF